MVVYYLERGSDTLMHRAFSNSKIAARWYDPEFFKTLEKADRQETEYLTSQGYAPAAVNGHFFRGTTNWTPRTEL